MDIIHEKALATILFSIVFIILIGAATPYIQQQISQTNEITDESLKYSKPALDGTNSDFDVDNIPMDDVVTSYARGDVNMDGEITTADYELILKHIAGNITFNEEQLYLGDVNSDGEIDNNDAERIKKMCEASTPSQYEKGDINRDGKLDLDDLNLLKKYLNGKVTFVLEQKKLADINNDGAIDSKDASLLNTMIGRINYEPGDVDKNEKITLDDAKLILDFLSGDAKLDEEQLELADIDKDGEVTSKDAQKIMAIARAG